MSYIDLSADGKYFQVECTTDERWELLQTGGGTRCDEGLKIRVDPCQIAIFRDVLQGVVVSLAASEYIRNQLAPPTRIADLSFLDNYRYAGELREYQKVGVAFVRSREKSMLCDQMGVGKTIQAIAAIETSERNRTALVICTSYARQQWAEEIKKWAGGPVKVWVVPSNKGKAGREQAWRECDAYLGRKYFVIHWDALRLMPKLQSRHWDWIVVDEAHHAKNRKAQRTRAMKAMYARHTVLLTGTPIINRPDELWSLLHYLYPMEYRSYWRFYNAFVDYVQLGGGRKGGRGGKRWRKVRGVKNTDILQRLVAGRVGMLRRLRIDVLRELPAAQELLYTVDMLPKQRELYTSVKKDVLVEIGRILGSHAENGTFWIGPALSKVVRLRQVATSTGLLSDIDESGKLDQTIDYIRDIVESREIVVVFGHFRKTVELVQTRLAKKGVPSGLFHGGTGDSDLYAFLHRHSKLRVLVCTFGVASESLNLQKASVGVFVELPYSPAKLAQAKGRLMRIGQKRSVTFATFVSRSTIDEHISRVLASKAEDTKRVLVMAEVLSRVLAQANN